MRVEAFPLAGTAWWSLPPINNSEKTPSVTRLYLTPDVTWGAADRGGRVLTGRGFIHKYLRLPKPPNIKELTDGSGGVGVGPGQLSR